MPKKTIGDLTLNEVFAIKQRCQIYKNCKQCREKDKTCFKVCRLTTILEKDELNEEIEEEK